ncbi:MAG: energy transducer TonB [Ferruginibacter sp.]
MKKLINFFSMIAVSGALLITGCNSESTTETTETSVPDTTQVMVTDTPQVVNADTLNHVSTVKPNPALKGKKGKVSTVMMTKNKTAAMDKDAEGYYSNVEVLPTFPGGKGALDNFINNNITYPADANENGIEAVVTVNFAVDEMGKVSNPHIVGNKVGYGLEDEVLRAINKMPTWTPGVIKGKNVKTFYTLPVNFKLDN